MSECVKTRQDGLRSMHDVTRSVRDTVGSVGYFPPGGWMGTKDRAARCTEVTHRLLNHRVGLHDVPLGRHAATIRSLKSKPKA